MSVRTPVRLMIVAGEASGDKHAASVVRALKEAYPQIDFEVFGSGGSEMRAAGVELLVDINRIATIGIIEVLGAIGKFYSAYRTLLSAARSRKPNAIVLVDWPDLNMALARRLKPKGFPIVYYISPQVWAWRRHRVKALRRDVDRMLVILPFEEEFYRNSGVPVEYVGHPLVDSVVATSARDEFCVGHSLDPTRPIIALLPGSRKKEIDYHLPPMLEAVSILSDYRFTIPDGRRGEPPAGSLLTWRGYTGQPQFALPLASTIGSEHVSSFLEDSSGTRGIRLIERDTYNLLAHSEFAIVASGTATVETALSGIPMVIIYRASQINWRLIRPLIRLDSLGMVNLIAGRKVVPELMQSEASGPNIARAVIEALSASESTDRIRGDLTAVAARLREGGNNASLRAARAIMREILPDMHREQPEVNGGSGRDSTPAGGDPTPPDA